MEFLPPVMMEIKVKATEAIAAFGEVNKELAKMEKNGLLASGSLAKVEKASRYAGIGLLALGGAFAAVGISSVEALDKVEKSQANLEVAIKNTGVAYEAAKPAVDAHAKSMMALGFTYDDTYAALAKMTAASGSPQLALDSLSVAADLARAKTMSLADAGNLVARASIGQAKGLGDLGIAIGKTLPKGASMAQIFKAIEDRVGGSARAFKNTLSGGIAVAQANFQALQIQIGTALVPTLIKVTDWITNQGIPKFGQFFGLIKNNMGWIKGLALVLGSVWATGKIMAFIGAIKEVITVYKTLAASAAVAAMAEALATGGANLALGTAAILAAGGVFAAAGVSYLAYKATNAPTAASPTPGSMKMPVPGTQPANLAGKGVTKVPAKSTATILQNVTIYASNTNDISSKLAKAAKNGIPLGGK